jgi:hypothetical protein
MLILHSCRSCYGRKMPKAALPASGEFNAIENYFVYATNRKQKIHELKVKMHGF